MFTVAINSQFQFMYTLKYGENIFYYFWSLTNCNKLEILCQILNKYVCIDFKEVNDDEREDWNSNDWGNHVVRRNALAAASCVLEAIVPYNKSNLVRITAFSLCTLHQGFVHANLEMNGLTRSIVHIRWPTCIRHVEPNYVEILHHFTYRWHEVRLAWHANTDCAISNALEL